MHAIIKRLQSGQRWWAAEVAARLLALIPLSLAGLCARLLQRCVQRQPRAPTLPDPCTPSQFLLVAAGFAVLVGGLALMIEGPGLFRLVPYPRRRLF